ncbi:MAG TPA: GH3 auxin-responsive promoter family protein [Candidatus Rifleibacterium sp.]|nr:GH3 auxin-responsive promoter family protein [Candidatus Rifleibacterium sp.]
MTGSILATGLVQSIWMGTCLGGAMELRRAANSNPARVQTRVLLELLQNASQTDFGRQHDFATIGSAEEFCASVRVHEYDDLKPYIDLIAAGKERVLTGDPVRMFEETSGTSGPNRLIPYTAGLQRAFNRALHPWLFDLFSHFGSLWGGPAYWVVSPRSAEKRTTAGGVPIGFAADSDYFGAWAKPLIGLVTVVPEEASGLSNPNVWKYVSLLCLLRQPQMRLISLWNPTLFTALLSQCGEWAASLAGDLENGTCCPAFLSASGLNDPVLRLYSGKPLPGRGKLLAEALRLLEKGDRSAFSRQLWPKMALISSWSEAEAGAGAEYLRSFFPDAAFQTKGLLATEGPVTIPMVGAPAPVLAARSAFFEFEEGEAGSGRIRLAHELVAGQRYRVLMTTAGGLYRYRLHDIVEMRGWWRNLPCLAFIGKEAFVSDLVGEKLSSDQVKAAFANLLTGFAGSWLAPEKPELPALPHYCLFLTTGAGRGKIEEADCRQLAERMDMAFCENIHYRWAREAGQLAPVKVVVLNADGAAANEIRLQRQAGLGRTLSTAKPGVLDKTPGWLEWLQNRGLL